MLWIHDNRRNVSNIVNRPPIIYPHNNNGGGLLSYFTFRAPLFNFWGARPPLAPPPPPALPPVTVNLGLSQTFQIVSQSVTKISMKRTFCARLLQMGKMIVQSAEKGHS